MTDAEPRWDDDDNRVIPEQPETWCYLNPNNQIVVRQKHSDPSRDDDPFVFFGAEHVPQLIAALQELAECAGAEDGQPEPAGPEPAKRPLTAAERQRRRRNKNRESHEARDTSHDERDEDPSLFS
jgi:hypothetical protein